MTVAFDAFTSNVVGSTNPSFTHTPVGTPRGVVVFVLWISANDEITGITYGGTAMSEVSGSPNLKAAAETMSMAAYFLGTSIPAGAQTVATAGSGVSGKLAYCYTVTAAADTAVSDSDGSINSDAVGNPSAILSLGGLAAFVCEALLSGQDVITGITPFAGWTSRHEIDGGAYSAGSYSYDTVGTADVTMGWTQATDDATCIGVAVREVAGGGGFRSRIAGGLVGG